MNTAQFRFPIGSPRPSWVEIANFLKQLDTDLMTVETVYKTAKDRSLFIKFVSKETMAESLQKNGNAKQFVYTNGHSVEVRMSIAGTNAQYVRVFDLPPELSDDNLSLVLKEYGKIDRVVREKFPANLGLDHVYNGIRGVYMDVAKAIPPTIDIGDKKGRIFYEGLKDTCFLCHGIGHRRDVCPQRQPRNKLEKKKKKENVSNSYAAIVAGKEPVSEVYQSAEKEDEDEIIEVLEEELIEESEEQPEEEQLQSRADLEKEIRRKKGLEELEKVAKAIQEAMRNPQANQRRAEFAASSSSSGSRPRKKVARRTYY